MLKPRPQEDLDQLVEREPRLLKWLEQMAMDLPLLRASYPRVKQAKALADKLVQVLKIRPKETDSIAWKVVQSPLRQVKP